ncbi:ABC transporter substrate-binding protein [Kribbella sp. NPDC004536]|uniref:ABC transporter substrate-binding protein n=1 Tax=Kribbella sp. NPDC004536 TaxID=3364106 RepID=UPI0036D0C8AB
MHIIRSAVSVAIVSSLLLAGCGGTEKNVATSSGASSPTAAGSSLSSSLAGVCPDPLVIQGNWLPAPELGALYSFIQGDPKIDTGAKKVSGRLVTRGIDMGIRLELRAGGPAIGYTQTGAQMYLDKSIQMAATSLDESIQLYAKQPTLSVYAFLDGDGQGILWDPQTYPDFKTIADIGKTNATVLYFDGDTYMQYLIGAGILKKSQVDGSYDGSPSKFVAGNGKYAQSGFVTNEPYVLEHDVKQWGKPVKYQLINDAGYPNYGIDLAIPTAKKDELAPCLKRLVPLIQRSSVDFIDSPATTLDFIFRLNEAYKGNTDHSPALLAYDAKTLKDTGLVGNGKNSTIGDFDLADVQKLLDITVPIFKAQKSGPASPLGPTELVTNEFVDPAIGRPAG